MHWVHVHPQGGKKLGAKFTGEIYVSAPQAESAPPRQSKSPIFEKIGEIWAVGEAI